jgi:hypothetical protein
MSMEEHIIYPHDPIHLVRLHPEIHDTDGVVGETGRNLAAFFVPAHFKNAAVSSERLQDPAFFHRPYV